MNLDLLFAVIFYFLIFLFFLKYRSRFEVQGKILALYRTKIGLKFMDKLSKISPKFMKYLGYVGITVGFLGMIAIFYILFKGTLHLIIKPDATPVVAPVLPGIKLPGLPTLSFWFWIISIFVVAAIHEFSHGVYARLSNLKIKSSGFAFLGPILAAFVEPDEKGLFKKSKKEQLSIFAAGPFSNVILFGVLFLISLFILNPAVASIVEYKGVQVIGLEKDFPLEKAGVREGELIISVNGINVSDPKKFVDVMNDVKPNEKILIKTNNSEYTVMTTVNPNDKEKGYLGVFVSSYTSDYKNEVTTKYGRFLPSALVWFSQLIFWIYIISFGIGLFNLLPLGPIDGGRMFFVASLFFTKNEKRARRVWSYISIVCLILIFINLLPYLIKLFSFLLHF